MKPGKNRGVLWLALMLGASALIISGSLALFAGVNLYPPGESAATVLEQPAASGSVKETPKSTSAASTGMPVPAASRGQEDERPTAIPTPTPAPMAVETSHPAEPAISERLTASAGESTLAPPSPVPSTGGSSAEPTPIPPEPAETTAGSAAEGQAPVPTAAVTEAAASAVSPTPQETTKEALGSTTAASTTVESSGSTGPASTTATAAPPVPTTAASSPFQADPGPVTDSWINVWNTGTLLLDIRIPVSDDAYLALLFVFSDTGPYRTVVVSHDSIRSEGDTLYLNPSVIGTPESILAASLQ